MSGFGGIASTILSTPFTETMDCSASWNGTGIFMDSVSKVSITVAVSGGTTPTGTFTLEASNDAISVSDASATWITVADSSQAITDNVNTLWNISDVAFRRIRPVYTRTSGTGTAIITINIKQ